MSKDTRFALHVAILVTLIVSAPMTIIAWIAHPFSKIAWVSAAGSLCVLMLMFLANLPGACAWQQRVDAWYETARGTMTIRVVACAGALAFGVYAATQESIIAAVMCLGCIATVRYPVWK